MVSEPILQSGNDENQSNITIPEELIAVFETCKRPILPGMPGVRFSNLDEFTAKGGSYIAKIPFRLRSLEQTYNNTNASIGDLWVTLRDYEELFKGLQFAQRDGIVVNELLSQVQELGYNALLRAAKVLLKKLRESYDPTTNKVDTSKGLSEDEHREISFWFKDFFKNIVVTGHEIPADLEQGYSEYMHSAQINGEEIVKRLAYAREEARKILGQ